MTPERKKFNENVEAGLRDLQLRKEIARLNDVVDQQLATINALMIGCEDVTTPVVKRIGELNTQNEALKQQLALAHDAINDALPWMIKLGDYIGNGTQADPMGRCNAILAMRKALGRDTEETEEQG